MPLASVGISLINTLEAYIALRVFNYYHLDEHLTRIKDFFGLIGLIIVVLQPISALLGNTVLLMLNIIQDTSFLHDVFYWWFGNIMGQLLFAPMLLILYYNKQKIQIREFILVFLLFAILNYLLQVLLHVDNVSLLLLITLPTTLYLTTTNVSYGSVGSVVLASVSLYFTHLGIGTFVQDSSQINNIINLNFFMLSHIILALVIGILFREKNEAIESLQAMAHFDFLTGLPNRHLLREKLQHTVYLADLHHQKSAICFVDLDGFKPINDTLGHHTGDIVLQKIVKRAKKYLIPEDAFLRIGGDEFLIILTNIQSRDDVGKRLQHILSSVSKTMYIEDHEIQISLSIGVAFCPEHGRTVKSLMSYADDAMYQAKKEGKNRFVFASSKPTK